MGQCSDSEFEIVAARRHQVFLLPIGLDRILDGVEALMTGRKWAFGVGLPH